MDWFIRCARKFESVGELGLLKTCLTAGERGPSTSSMLRMGVGAGLSTSSILRTGAVGEQRPLAVVPVGIGRITEGQILTNI